MGFGRQEDHRWFKIRIEIVGGKNMRMDCIGVVVVGFGLGCSGSDSHSDSDSDSDSAHQGDSGADVYQSEYCGEPGETYTAGMSHPGDEGAMAFFLVASDPAPPDKGENTFTILVQDLESGIAVDGATVNITPFMPEHGHGTNPADYATEATGESGTYQSVPINLFMSGLWDLTFSVASGESVLDETTFTFCLEG